MRKTCDGELSRYVNKAAPISYRARAVYHTSERMAKEDCEDLPGNLGWAMYGYGAGPARKQRIIEMLRDQLLVDFTAEDLPLTVYKVDRRYKVGKFCAYQILSDLCSDVVHQDVRDRICVIGSCDLGDGSKLKGFTFRHDSVLTILRSKSRFRHVVKRGFHMIELGHLICEIRQCVFQDI